MATRNFGAGSDEKNTLISLLDAIVSGETEMSSDEIISAINTLKAERKKAAKRETKKEKEDRISIVYMSIRSSIALFWSQKLEAVAGAFLVPVCQLLGLGLH